MTETIEQLTQQINEVGQEIKRLDAVFLESVGDPTKSQDNKRMYEKVMSLHNKQTGLLKKLARLCLRDD